MEHQHAVLIGRKYESKVGQCVTFQVFKGRKKSATVLTLPILPPFRDILDASELGSGTWLETLLGKPYGAAGFGNSFKDWCMEAGTPKCNRHGPRKIGAIRAAEAGASEHELMAMFNWENADMGVSTRGRPRKKLAASGAAKLSLGRPSVPPVVPPREKERENNKLETRWCPRPDSNQHALAGNRF